MPKCVKNKHLAERHGVSPAEAELSTAQHLASSAVQINKKSLKQGKPTGGEELVRQLLTG